MLTEKRFIYYTDGMKDFINKLIQSTISSSGAHCTCKQLPDHSPREEMRRLIVELSTYAHELRQEAIVMHTNGLDLGATQAPTQAYFQAIDGVITESLFFSYENGKTISQPLAGTRDQLNKCGLYNERNKTVLAIEYKDPSAPLPQTTADERAAATLFEHFQAFTPVLLTADPLLKELTPPQNGTHPGKVSSLDDVRSFAYVINSGDNTRQTMMDTLSSAPHDLFVLDHYAAWQAPYTPDDLHKLHMRADGSHRLLLGYISIGEAAKHFYYWKKEWNAFPPCWAAGSNTNWGSVRARYWCPHWKRLMYQYVQMLLSMGFDGIVMDTVDVYAAFEGESAANI